MPHHDLHVEYMIKVEGHELSPAIMRLVKEVRVASAIDKADMVKIRALNPLVETYGKARSSELTFIDSNIWAPGNTVEVWANYGRKADVFIGAGIIKKWKPRFPSGGIPQIDIVAYDLSSDMMDGDENPACSEARSFDTGMALHEIAQSVLDEYNFVGGRVDETKARSANLPIVKRAGMTDYVFVRALAYMVGYDFTVTYDPEKKGWTYIWGKLEPDDSVYQNFAWGPEAWQSRLAGIGIDVGLPNPFVLLEFEADLKIKQIPTDVEVYHFDTDTGTFESIKYPPEEKGARASRKPELRWQGDHKSIVDDLRALGTPEGAESLRIAFNGISIDVIPGQNFESAEAAYEWAKSWWLDHQRLMLQGTGKTIGLPQMRAGQIHGFSGIGESLSDDWYFFELEHIFKRGAPYLIDFVARRVIG